jgi:hypothetical protein
MVSDAERAAMRGDPAPSGLSWRGKIEYLFFLNLYKAYHNQMVSRDQASDEKKRFLAELNKAEESREFERKCWENSAKRTIAADRALMMYHRNRTLENADILYDRLEWLHDECARPVVNDKCPGCGKWFSPDHAERKPTYCEDCGCRLGWD